MSATRRDNDPGEPEPYSDLALSFALTPSLHPRLLIGLPATPATCAIHLSLLLPDELFVDPSELAHIWGPPSSPSSLLPTSGPAWALTPAVIDVERPYAASSPRARLDVIAAADADVPLHARYLPPAALAAHNLTVFPRGSVRAGLACGRSVHAELRPVRADLALVLPAARDDIQAPVDAVTAGVVWAGWAWLVYKLLRVRQRK
ncbi:hypothetical protein Q5752_000294 [Cryptotrichosporon argae]